MHHCVCIIVLLLPLIVSVVDCVFSSPYGFVYISGTMLLLLLHVVVVAAVVVATVLLVCFRSCSCSCFSSSFPPSSCCTSCTSTSLLLVDSCSTVLLVVLVVHGLRLFLLARCSCNTVAATREDCDFIAAIVAATVQK